MTAAVWSSEYALCLVHIQSEGAHKQTDATGRPSPAATNFSTQEQAVCPKRERAPKLSVSAGRGKDD